MQVRIGNPDSSSYVSLPPNADPEGLRQVGGHNLSLLGIRVAQLATESTPTALTADRVRRRS